MDIKSRVINEANYIINTKNTIRQTAKYFNKSKSTIHDDLHNKLKKKDHYNVVTKKENKKKRFTGTLVLGIVVYALFFMTVTGVEYSRLSKQWNREFLVEKFGVYTYQLNDLFKSLDAKFNTLFLNSLSNLFKFIACNKALLSNLTFSFIKISYKSSIKILCFFTYLLKILFSLIITLPVALSAKIIKSSLFSSFAGIDIYILKFTLSIGLLMTTCANSL